MTWKHAINLRWTPQERAWHVVKDIVASLALPALAVGNALHEAKRPVRPCPGHLKTCGTEYRGCDPQCPARLWDEAYEKEFP